MLLDACEEIGKLRLEGGDLLFQAADLSRPHQNLAFEKSEISLDFGWQTPPNLWRKNRQFSHRQILALVRLPA
jgi:hypothetical protein